MNHVDHRSRVKHQNDLKIDTGLRAAADDVLSIADLSRIRADSGTHHLVGLNKRHSVFGQMLDIPFVPTKLIGQLSVHQNRGDFQIIPWRCRVLFRLREADLGRVVPHPR